MKRIDTRLKLAGDTATYVKEQQEAKGLSSLTKTIEQLLQEHQNEEERRAEQAYWTSMMMETIQEKVQEELQWHFKQLQVGVNRYGPPFANAPGTDEWAHDEQRYSRYHADE